jgi:hypothetical protein
VAWFSPIESWIVPDPVPVAPELIDAQETFTWAAQVHDAPVVTPTLAVAASGPTLVVDGAS